MHALWRVRPVLFHLSDTRDRLDLGLRVHPGRLLRAAEAAQARGRGARRRHIRSFATHVGAPHRRLLRTHGDGVLDIGRLRKKLESRFHTKHRTELGTEHNTDVSEYPFVGVGECTAGLGCLEKKWILEKAK